MEKELKDYIEKVATSVINKLNMNSDDKTYTYEEVSVTKNNGIEHNGFTVIESDNNIAPSFYVNTYFESNEDVDKVADMFYDLYLESVNDNVLAGNNIVKNIGDFDLVKDNIFVFLCNYAKNYDFKGPNVKVGDLMIRFKIIVRQGEDGLFTIPITKEIYDQWNTGLTSEEFLDMAYENTKRLFPLKIKSLEDVINDKLKEQGLSLPKMENYEMYVVTNDSLINGAIYMLDNNVLSDLSNKMNSSKLIILPSSIHETIVIPYNDAIKDEHDMEYISHMVEEINDTELSDDEYLSDTPYIYDNDTKELIYTDYTDNEISIPFIA